MPEEVWGGGRDKPDFFFFLISEELKRNMVY